MVSEEKMFEIVDGRTDGRRTDAGVTGILLAHPWAFGSGELKSHDNLPNSGFWGWLSTESQPQNPEFRNNPENFHPCITWDRAAVITVLTRERFLSRVYSHMSLEVRGHLELRLAGRTHVGLVTCVRAKVNLKLSCWPTTVWTNLAPEIVYTFH